MFQLNDALKLNKYYCRLSRLYYACCNDSKAQYGYLYYKLKYSRNDLYNISYLQPI